MSTGTETAVEVSYQNIQEIQYAQLNKFNDWSQGKAGTAGRVPYEGTKCISAGFHLFRNLSETHQSFCFSL